MSGNLSNKQFVVFRLCCRTCPMQISTYRNYAARSHAQHTHTHTWREADIEAAAHKMNASHFECDFFFGTM